jgi:hypothetical protein
LSRQGEAVCEIGRGPRDERRLRGKDDSLDAIRAARTALEARRSALNDHRNAFLLRISLDGNPHLRTHRTDLAAPAPLPVRLDPKAGGETVAVCSRRDRVLYLIAV